MRSGQVYVAVARDSNRFQLCRMVSRGVRVTHQDGTRIEDSIGSILETIGAHTCEEPGSFNTALPGPDPASSFEN